MKGHALGAGLRRLAPLLMAIAVSGLTGCAGPEIAPKKLEQLVWPAMPDQPRFAFEATLQSQSNIVPESKDSRLQRMVTGVAPDAGSGKIIGKPSGIAVRDGRIYVAEPGVKAVSVLDAARGKLYRFGQRAPHTLQRPQAIALDDEGLVYVLDSILRKVMVFDALGLFQFSIDTGAGFTNPAALAVSPDGKTIYVVDRGDVGNTDQARKNSESARAVERKGDSIFHSPPLWPSTEPCWSPIHRTLEFRHFHRMENSNFHLARLAAS